MGKKKFSKKGHGGVFCLGMSEIRGLGGVDQAASIETAGVRGCGKKHE